MRRGDSCLFSETTNTHKHSGRQNWMNHWICIQDKLFGVISKYHRQQLFGSPWAWLNHIYNSMIIFGFTVRVKLLQCPITRLHIPHLVVLKSKYFGIIKTVLWLLMPCLFCPMSSQTMWTMEGFRYFAKYEYNFLKYFQQNEIMSCYHCGVIFWKTPSSISVSSLRDIVTDTGRVSVWICYDFLFSPYSRQHRWYFFSIKKFVRQTLFSEVLLWHSYGSI